MTVSGTPQAEPAVDVAFIIINHSTKLLLKRLLQFFREASFSFTYSLVVVDNASGDGSRDLLEASPDVTAICNEENLGYGRAMNRGIAASSSRYLCLIDTDAILNAEALEALVRHCDSHGEVQICSPVVRTPSGRIQGFVFSFRLRTLYSDFFRKKASKAWNRKILSATEPLRVEGLSAAFVFCRRTVVKGAELFDGTLSGYFEDMDCAHRLFRAGAVCEVLPRYGIVRIDDLTGSISDLHGYYTAKYRYVRKNYGNGQASLLRLSDLWVAKAKSRSYRLAYLVTRDGKFRYKNEKFCHLAQVIDGIQTDTEIK